MRRQCARFAANLSKYDSVSQFITHDMKWLFCKYLYRPEVLKFVHAIRHDYSPSYFKEYMDLNPVLLNHTRSGQYSQPALTTASRYGTMSLCFSGPYELFRIPPSISLDSFLSICVNLCNEYLSSLQNNEYSPNIVTDGCYLSCIDDVIASLFNDS